MQHDCEDIYEKDLKEVVEFKKEQLLERYPHASDFISEKIEEQLRCIDLAGHFLHERNTLARKNTFDMKDNVLLPENLMWRVEKQLLRIEEEARARHKSALSRSCREHLN